MAIQQHEVRVFERGLRGERKIHSTKLPQESWGHQRQVLVNAMLHAIRDARQGKFVFNMKEFKANLVVMY